jgi:hypothetical protein
VTDDELRIDITSADIATAERQWQAARDRGAPDDRVARLFDSYQRLIGARAQQLTDDSHRGP